jgi:hypothetical protein
MTNVGILTNNGEDRLNIEWFSTISIVTPSNLLPIKKVLIFNYNYFSYLYQIYVQLYLTIFGLIRLIIILLGMRHCLLGYIVRYVSGADNIRYTQ